MSTTVSKTMLYQCCTFQNNTSSTLQELFAQEYSKRLAYQRMEELSSSQTKKSARFTNHVMRHGTDGLYLCGEIISFTSGNFQSILEIASEKQDLEVSQVPPPKGSGNNIRAEFIDSILYFAIRKNHVVLLSHKDKFSSFEQYVNWFLFQNDISETSQRVTLSNIIPIKIKEQLKQLNKITLNKQYSHTEKTGKGKDKIERVVVDETNIGALKSLMNALFPGLKNKIDTRYIEDALKSNALDASIVLHVKGASNTDVNPLFQLLSSSIIDGNESLSKYTIDAGKYGNWNGSELRLSKDATITTNESIPLLHSVFDKLSGWLESLFINNQVSL